MRYHPSRRALGLLFATTLLFAACGDDDTAATDESADVVDHGTDMDDAEHSHGDGIEVGDLDDVPTIQADARIDPKSGVNLHVTTTNYAFAPEHASTEHVDNEGHFHVYDGSGTKLGRFYNEWVFLDLPAGEHVLEVELSSNNHSPLLVDGQKIAQLIDVTVPEASAHMHGDDVEFFEADEPFPTVSIDVVEDPKAGYNVHIETTDFTFAPEKASTSETESGEGHAHFYVNGNKITRLYGNWFHYDGPVVAGDNDFRVELSANDHSPYAAAGELIEASVVVTAEEASGDAAETTGDHDHSHDDPDGEAAASDATAADADQTIEITVADGAVDGGGRIAVELGSIVAITVSSDVDDEIHVHGYDAFAEIAAGGTETVVVTATIPGVFEVEFERSGLQLLELEIS